MGRPAGGDTASSVATRVRPSAPEDAPPPPCGDFAIEAAQFCPRRHSDLTPSNDWCVPSGQSRCERSRWRTSPRTVATSFRSPRPEVPRSPLQVGGGRQAGPEVGMHGRAMWRTATTRMGLIAPQECETCSSTSPASKRPLILHCSDQSPELWLLTI